ncbi:MAG: hypothetical protein PVF58_08240 [Candidatus Methanofastidiosia archaeon]|jgi:hypothetical protein
MYKGYPICITEDGTVSVLRLKLERLEEIRLHEEVLPDAFRKICRAICEEQVLQDPIFVDEDSKVILDGMHRAAALLKLKYGECKDLFWDEQTKEYTYPECENCSGKFKNLEYILCCTLDYDTSTVVTLKKWYRGIQYPLKKTLEIIPSEYTVQKTEDIHLGNNECAVLTDGDEYFSVSGDFTTVLDKYTALREIEQKIREQKGTIMYCADEEAFNLLEKGVFSCLLVTPTIDRQNVQTFSTPGFPHKGEVFPPKSTRHVLSTRPLKVNIPLRLLEKGDYSFKQEQLKVFLRRKRKLTVSGRLGQYLEKHKILFGEPGELREPGKNAYVWACEFPREFYEIKYHVDQFIEDVESALIKNGMELAYSALIRETNRLILILSDVSHVEETESLITSLMDTYFGHLDLENLFGYRDDTPVWMIPMEGYTPSRAYFERNERLLRKLKRMHKILTAGAFKKEYTTLREYSLPDILVLFAFHVLKEVSRCKVFEYLHEDIEDHTVVFSHIKGLIKKGLITQNNLVLTSQGKTVIQKAVILAKEIDQISREFSSDTFSGLLEKIDSNIDRVIKPDGRKDVFHMGSIMESLIFTDMGWEKVADALDMVAEEVEHVDFASSDELSSFLLEYLQEKHPLTNIPFRYDYFINSRNYIFIKEDQIVSLSRKRIEKDIKKHIPAFLKITASQRSKLSNMVYEGVRFLTIPLVKELYEKERIVIQPVFLSQIETFVVHQAVPVLKKISGQTQREVLVTLEGIFTDARAHVDLCMELLCREDKEFIKYYLMAMDSLTEGISLVMGRVPAFDVFGRLTQLGHLARNQGTEVIFASPKNKRTFLLTISTVLRRSTSLLDQWRSHHTEHHGNIALTYKKFWHKHVLDVCALIDRCTDALHNKVCTEES